MAITSNIFVGIVSWAPSTIYSAGDRRSNGGNAYQCIKGGTSSASGGPTGTSSQITDGSATWKYLAHVDYVTLSSWASGIPASLTQPVIGLLWDCGTITTTAGVAYLTLSGHTTSAANTITLKPAPGEGIRDFLATGTIPLAFNPSLGVRFVLPSAVGSTNYFVVNDNNVILDGLQIQDPFSTSNSSLIATRDPASLVLRDCILDGYAQPGGAGLLDFAAQATCYNCLIVDRATAGGFGPRIAALYGSANNSSLINCTIVSVAAPTSSGGPVSDTGVTGCFVRNCAFFGYDQIMDGGTTVSLPFDHCAFSKSSPIGGLSTDNGGNIFSVVASSQFVNETTDFRIRTPVVTGPTGPFAPDFSPDFIPTQGVGLIGGGISDTIDIPSDDDIATHQRITWDIGAWAYTISASGSGSVGALRSTSLSNGPAFSSGFSTGFATAATSNGAVGRSGINIQVSSLAAQSIGSSGMARLIFMVSSSTARQANGSSGAISVAIVRAVGAARLTNPAQTGTDPFSGEFSPEFGPTPCEILFSVAGTASVTNATAVASFFSLSVSGIAAQQGTATSNLMTLTCVAGVVPLLQFVGLANIDWVPAVAPLTSYTNSSAVSTILPIGAASLLTQRARASGGGSISISGVGAIGSSAATAITVLTLSASGTVAIADLAFALATLNVLSVQQPTPPLLQSDAIAPLFLAADNSSFRGSGTPFLLAADVIVPNLTSTTFSSGTATIPTLSCAAQALFQTFWSAAATTSYAVSAQAAQFTVASGGGVVPSLVSVASAVQRGAASGIASLERLAASAQVGQVDSSACLATIPSLSASAGAQGFDGAAAAVSVPALTATATVGVGTITRALAAIQAMTASGALSFALGLSGASRVAISVTGQMGQVNSVSGLASLSLAGAGVSTVGVTAIGFAILPAIAGAGSAVLTSQASGASQLLGTSASGSAINTIESASGVATAMAIIASGSASVNGSQMNGVASISFNANGGMMGEVEAAVLVELENIVAAHAKLWVTPTGYEQGDQVVFWAD